MGGGFGDIFSSFFGGGRQRDTGPKKAKPKLVKIEVTLEEIYAGTSRKISHKRNKIC
jgi:DnaJ-class molecular chaperone